MSSRLIAGRTNAVKKNLLLIPVIVLIILWMVSHSAVPLAAAIVLGIIWAYRSDRTLWRDKPTDQLVAILKGGEWAKWDAAIEQLQRRGENISLFIPRLVTALVSDSLMTRAAAEATLKKWFPEFKENLKGYLPSRDVGTSRKQLESLLARYDV